MSRCAERWLVLAALVLSTACGQEDGPAEQPDPRIATFRVAPLPPVAGQPLEIAVEGQGLVRGSIRQGEVEIYAFVNGGTSVVGTASAASAVVPVLTVRGVGGQTATAEATALR